MKKIITILLLLTSLNMYAQEPKEIENKVSAVREANPGDYILLPSGKRYILSREEIAIARNEFDFNDLTEVESTVNEDGAEVYRISQGHTVYVYTDGQSIHVLRTSVSFSAFMNHIWQNFYIAEFVDYYGDLYESAEIRPPEFDVFRASVKFQIISNEIDEMQSVDVTAYNFNGENTMMRFTSRPEMFWGNILEEGAYMPVGETRQIEFDIE